MCSPSTALKVNCLVIRHLYFRSVRGDLQEGHGCASRYQFPFFLVPIPVSRARKRDFCALLPSRTPIFGYFEHKIEVFVRFWLPGPPFSGISSTKSGFLCAFGVWNPHFRAFRAQNRGFCALRDKHDSRRRSERQLHCRTREWHIIRLVFILSRIGK